MILDKQQVRIVEKYLKRNGVENRLILGDFLDHICCMIEQKIDSGYSFSSSMEVVIKELPGYEIKQIELFTLKWLNMETSFSSRISLLATIPFWIFGLAWASSASSLQIPGFIELFLLIGSAFSMFALLCIGWIKDFPRWSFPAIGFSLLFTLFFMMITIPSFSPEKLGIWALAPLLIALFIGFIFRPTLEPIKMFARKIKEEPALLLFVLYGFVPFISYLFCDEIQSSWVIPIALISTLILSSGIYFFLRNERKEKRLFSILISGFLVLILTFTFSQLFWNSLG